MRLKIGKHGRKRVYLCKNYDNYEDIKRALIHLILLVVPTYVTLEQQKKR